MKKVVIAGSAKLQKEINNWLQIFESKDYEVLDYPRKIEKEKFMELYPNIHKSFFECITRADMLFIMNEDKNGKSGYIGAEAFAELTFGLSQKLVYNKEIELIILKMPSQDVECYEEINLWLKLGWIKLYEEEESIKEYILKWIDTFDDVLTRKNEFGHFASSAFVVNKERTKMLVVYHNIYDAWIFPGGHADGEENLLSVAVREVEEETGLKPKILDESIFAISASPIVGHVKKGKYVPAHTHLDVVYLLRS